MKIITSTINIFKEQRKHLYMKTALKKTEAALRIKKTTLEKNEVSENIYKEDISKEDNYESITMVLTTQTVVYDRKVVKLTFLTRTSS